MLTCPKVARESLLNTSEQWKVRLPSYLYIDYEERKGKGHLHRKVVFIE
jgi:hypothetical protein